jgi:predicted ATPase
LDRRTEPVAGRNEALAALEGHLVAALRGAGRVVGVEGECGSGRTEIALGFLRSCRERGLSISGVECRAHGHPATLAPGRTLLRGMLGVSEDALAEPARAEIAATLTALDPGIATELPLLFDFLGLGEPEEGAAAASDLRAPLLALVARIVRTLASGVPEVLLVDDVDHADPASLELFSAIAEATDGSRALLLTTSGPAPRFPWMDKPCFHALALPRGDAASPASPPLEALADDERVALGVAAAIGLHFSLPMLRRACDLDNERLAAALYALQQSGFVRARSRSPEAGFAFVHPGVRDAALDALSDAERAAAHARVALAIEEIDFEHLDERAPLLAHHWERAAQPAAAARWHRHAARCVARWSPAVAETHRRRAEALE